MLRTLFAMRRSGKCQFGQAILMVAIVLAALLGGIGLAVDLGMGYYYNTAAERAAAAAALSGVVFMPYQFSPASASPPGSGNDATDRAIAEARRNGFDVADTADNVQVTPAQVSGADNKLQVTVSRTVPTFFMRLFGFSTYTISRTAVATYLPPLQLGQPGSQLGSTASQLGSGNNFYFMREEGWATDRQQGDAFTPNPADPSAPQYASTDVHLLSSQVGTDTVDPSLPSRGGYNYRITLPAGGGYIQVYNAAFAPDGGNGKAHNNCENSKPPKCSGGGNYYLHEEDSVNLSDATTFNAMEYTLFSVRNQFIRSSDVKLSQFKVLPIDASNWNGSSNHYRNVNNGSSITQSYDVNGNPSNMRVYHSWVNVNDFNGETDNGLVVALKTYSPGQPLPAGMYRLRVDSLDNQGNNPVSATRGVAHKGYAVRILDSLGNPCTQAGCSLGAWDDLCYYTPISVPGGGAFTIPLFQVPPDYAGKVVSVQIYDPGDLSSAGNVTINILDPSGGPVSASPPQQIRMYDLGPSRNVNPLPAPFATPSTVSFVATSNGTVLYNGHWVEIDFPIPASYAPPASDPSKWWWNLQYVTSNNTTAVDTVTVAISYRGNPAHLLQS